MSDSLKLIISKTSDVDYDLIFVFLSDSLSEKSTLNRVQKMSERKIRKDFLNGTWVQTKTENMDKVRSIHKNSPKNHFSDFTKNGLQLASA